MKLELEIPDEIIAFLRDLGYDDKKAREYLRHSLLDVLGTNIDDYLVEPNTLLKESFRANVSAIVQAHMLVKKHHLVDIPEINEHIAWRCDT